MWVARGDFVVFVVPEVIPTIMLMVRDTQQDNRNKGMELGMNR